MGTIDMDHDHDDRDVFRVQFSPLDIRITISQPADAGVLQRLTAIETTLQEIKSFMATVNDVLTSLQTAVANETTVDQSVLTFLQGIPALIAAAVAAANANQALTADQEAAFTNLSNTITANAAGLSAAVTANTPAPPKPPAVP